MQRTLFQRKEESKMKIADKIAHCAGGKPCIDCEFDKRDFPKCVARLLNVARDEIERLERRLAEAKTGGTENENHAS